VERGLGFLYYSAGSQIELPKGTTHGLDQRQRGNERERPLQEGGETLEEREEGLTLRFPHVDPTVGQPQEDPRVRRDGTVVEGVAIDAVAPETAFRREPKIAHIIGQIPPDDLDAFGTIGYTIGGMMVFPGNRIGRKMAINGARGFHPRIKDRFDLTVECIRRYYLGQISPLSEVLERYADFFSLFEDFRGYVEFFLLQDLVNEDFSAVVFFTAFDGFKTSPLPSTKESYVGYMRLAMEFIEARNRRIVQSG